jgi:LPS export ABC transporter protein LptC/lipopolysaccharide transport protein LptA
MRKKTLFSIFIFSLAFCLAYFAYFKIKNILSSDEKIFPTILLGEEGPSMTIKGFKLEESKGERLEWVLSANEARMFKNKGEILFTVVNTEVLGDGNKRESYTIKSDNGTYYTKQDKMNFNGNVGMQTSNGYDFVTDDVFYMAKEKKLETDKDVIIKGTSQKGEKIYVSGKGLKGDVNASDFKIMDNAVTKLGDNLEVQSQSALVNTKDSTAVFVEKINAKKGNVRIKGDKLEVSYTNKGDVNDIDVAGNVRLNIEKKLALCDNAVIKGSSNEIVLTGKPELHMAGDIMVGEKIVFFTDNDEVYVERVKADVSQGGYKK